MIAPAAVASLQYVEELFKTGEDSSEERERECVLCQKTYSKGSGYSSLVNHLKTQHPDYVRTYGVKHPPTGTAGATQPTVDSFFCASLKAKQLWYWVRKAVLLPEPFICVESPTAREGSAYGSRLTERLSRS